MLQELTLHQPELHYVLIVKLELIVIVQQCQALFPALKVITVQFLPFFLLLEKLVPITLLLVVLLAQTVLLVMLLTIVKTMEW